MSVATNEATQPLSSGEFEFIDPERYDDVVRKHSRLAEFLGQHDYDAVLLQRPENFSWLTSGAEPSRNSALEPAAALFVTPDARVVVANNVDAAQLFDKHLGGLGFQLKQRPWHEDRQVLLDDLCRGRNVASDTGERDRPDEGARLAALRLPLDSIECERIRRLGAFVAHAVEATARHVEPGQTETEVAGQMAHRLLRHEVRPGDLRVVGDGRGTNYRHWTGGDQAIHRWCSITAVGSRFGLWCAATRTVVFGSPTPEFVASFQEAALLEATGVFFSQAGVPLSELWKKVRRIYEKQNLTDEWQLADQADVVGYRPSEVQVVPASNFVLAPRMAMHWHPSVRSAQVGDTMLVRDDGPELITRPTEWPLLGVTVRGHPLHLPDILIREQAAQSGP